MRFTIMLLSIVFAMGYVYTGAVQDHRITQLEKRVTAVERVLCTPTTQPQVETQP